MSVNESTIFKGTFSLTLSAGSREVATVWSSVTIRMPTNMRPLCWSLWNILSSAWFQVPGLNRHTVSSICGSKHKVTLSLQHSITEHKRLINKMFNIIYRLSAFISYKTFHFIINQQQNRFSLHVVISSDRLKHFKLEQLSRNVIPELVFDCILHAAFNKLTINHLMVKEEWGLSEGDFRCGWHEHAEISRVIVRQELPQWSKSIPASQSTQ